MNVRIDLEIVTTERQGSDILFIEGRASDGTQAAFYLRLASLGSEPPQSGQRLTLTLSGTQATAPSLRERMQAPRAATTTPPTATATTARSSAATAPQQDASGMLLASIIGTTSTTSASFGERDVDDEMDALLGPPRRKG